MRTLCSSEKKGGDAVLGSGTGWSVACTTVEEWNEVVDSLKGSKHAETKRLHRALQGIMSILLSQNPYKPLCGPPPIVLPP